MTFLLDFGIPQITIEIDGIKVQAKLIEDVETGPREQHLPDSRSSRPRGSASPSHTRHGSNEAYSDDDEHVPTVDDLANSFIREEPKEELRELEHELETQSGYLQESIVSNDGDDEVAAGMGAPLALPVYFRNILNTALDRISMVINNVQIEVEDQAPLDLPTESKQNVGSPVSLSFHIQRIAIDSMTSLDTGIDVKSATPMESVRDPDSKLGKRRLHVENICARLISDAENFVSMSRFSRPSSPATTRSEISSSHNEASELSPKESSAQQPYSPPPAPAPAPPPQQLPEALEPDTSPTEDTMQASSVLSESLSSAQASIPSLVSEHSVHISPPPVEDLPHEEPQLASSVHTIDDDRFADAASDTASDEGYGEHAPFDSPAHSRHSLPVQDMSASSILYDDEGLLDYAVQNSMLDSRFDDAPLTQPEEDAPFGSESASSGHHDTQSANASEASSTTLPTVSALGRSFRAPEEPNSPSKSHTSEQLQPSTDNLLLALTDAGTSATSSIHEPPALPPSSATDLAESQLFTHDDAESMYLSAISAPRSDSMHQQHIPGGWDSSSNSSHGTSSDKSGSISIPDEMISGSILEPLPEADEGCETPRPGSRQSLGSSPRVDRAETPMAQSTPKQAKSFLTIDEITVWFPLGLDDGRNEDQMAESTTEASGIDFKSPGLGEDSFFAEMPGSFSNYAQSSSHRRIPSQEEATRRRPNPKTVQYDQSPEPKRKPLLPSIIVEVGGLAAHTDLSTARIMFTMLNRVLQAVTGDQGPSQTEPKAKEAPEDAVSSLELAVKHVGIAWVENIVPELLAEDQSLIRLLDLNPVDALLCMTMSKVRVVSQNRKEGSRAKLQIGSFALNSLNREVVSFHNPKSKSRRSVSALLIHLSNDVEIDHEQGKDTRITVVTRPIKVVFDVQQLDEALSSFGGFSGMLELSSSISSTNTVQSPVVSPTRPQSRGVHFGDSLPPAIEKAPASTKMPKIQVQFGEVSFTLKGKACAVQLQTTSVRIAVRESNVRLKVSELHLSGPYVDEVQKGAPLLVEIRGTTVNFLFAPEETDLARLISMITPSKDPYENNDDILIETLLRQRRKGSVLRVEVSEVGVRLSDMEQMSTFGALGVELARLSKVAKYLPDDDRPGLLTLATVRKVEAGIAVNARLGDVSVSLQNASMAHVGVPALLAAELGNVIVRREDEILIHEVIKLRPQDQLPAIMVRIVGDEMEPVVKMKFFNLCAEYWVTTVMAALGISEDGTTDDIALGIASSVATITGASSPTTTRQSTQTSLPSTAPAKPLQIDVLLRNCALGLNPRKISSKGLFVLTEAHIAGKQAKSDYSITVEFRKASMHAIDDVARLEEERDQDSPSGTQVLNPHLRELRDSGFVSLSSISAAKVYVNIAGDGNADPHMVDVEFKNELFVLESCADSTQTLIAILNGLQPPTPPSTAERYRTVVPLQEMMESFTGEMVSGPEGGEEDDFMSTADLVEDEVPTNLEFVGSFYNSQSLPTDEELGDSLLGEDDLGALASPPTIRQRGDRALLESFQEKYEVEKGEEGFDFSENYFKDSDNEQQGKAKKWDSAKNQYHLSNEFKSPDAPLKVRVRDVNIIWNLYDGYDWPRTRAIINQAVDEVEARAEERRRKAKDEDEDDDFVEEDFLFNSVWIGVPVKDEKGALARRINHDIDDLVSETGSYATSTATRSTGATGRSRSSTKSRRRLKLERSKHKKIAFSLMGVSVDLIVFPPETGETINSIDVRVHDLEVFDHVPTSTWKKFVTCQIAPSAREIGRPMINLEIVTVKPITDLAASELVIKVSHQRWNNRTYIKVIIGNCTSITTACGPGCS